MTPRPLVAFAWAVPVLLALSALAPERAGGAFAQSSSSAGSGGGPAAAAGGGSTVTGPAGVAVTPPPPRSVAAIAFAGHMGRRAALMIDGQPVTVALGETVSGVKLLEVSSAAAKVERDGAVLILYLGAVPAGPAAAPPSRDLIMRADADGHFLTFGAINGLPVRFMVDTGATSITMSQAEADRLGLDWRGGQRTQAATANGSVPANIVSLATVKVGELAAANLSAVVVPAQLPNVLLGNNFLGRFNLRRDNDVMRLEPKP